MRLTCLFSGDNSNAIRASGVFGKKEDRLWLPVSAYLIEHSKGRFLVDTGWAREMSPKGEFDRKAQIRSLGTVMLYEVNQGRIGPGQCIDEQLLAMGIRETEYARGKISLIICGHMAVDGDTAQIGPELAETLNLPHVSNVLKITEVDPKERYIVVECIAAEGRQTLKVSLPALLTVSKDINVLRLPSIAGIRNADQAEIRLLTAADLNADPERIGKAGSATQVVRTFTPAFNGGAERITGTSKEAASKIREIIGRIL